ncbi:MAG: hydroxysqualene dehydroxylase HpnE [Pseudomonadota bacterium]|nr:hydroxysqualene dehydroxylase HpnE [Pseudomonadota bacterium]
MPAQVNPKVAIVGGGWAGIACAVELAEQGVPVTLFEAARQLGGRARRVDWFVTNAPPLAIDNGQHLMIGAYRETRRLLARLGAADKLERRPLQLIVPGFRLRLPTLPAPLHLAVGLLSARGLNLREKFAAARFMRHLQALHFKLPADLPAGELLDRQRQPANLVARLWAPICIAALNTPLECASAQVFCNVLRNSLAGARADSDLLMNRTDLGSLLADPALAYLARHQSEAKLACKIDALVRHENGFHLDGPDIAAATVVLATHPARLPALLAGLPELAGIVAQVSSYSWQPILTLWLRFATPPTFPFPMLGLGDGQAPWAFERNDIAPGVVAIVMSAEGPHLQLSPEALRDDYLRLLARQLGPLPALLNWKTIVEKRATYACIPDMQRPGNRTPLNGLYLAGDYTAAADPTNTYPATLEGAVRSGVECARLILADRK